MTPSPKERKILLEQYGGIYRDALKHVRKTWGFTENEILSQRRDKRLVDARAYVAKALYDSCERISYPEVGVIIDRHHTSVMHLCGRLCESKARAKFNRKLKEAGVKDV